MIARLDADRRGQRGEPPRRRIEFAHGAAHGQIAGADHRIRPLIGHSLSKAVEGVRILRAEMDVADMEKWAWGLS
jgi:hypothetical protein